MGDVCESTWRTGPRPCMKPLIGFQTCEILGLLSKHQIPLLVELYGLFTTNPSALDVRRSRKQSRVSAERAWPPMLPLLLAPAWGCRHLDTFQFPQRPLSKIACVPPLYGNITNPQLVHGGCPPLRRQAFPAGGGWEGGQEYSKLLIQSPWGVCASF